jgi:hypothetical protein
MLQEGPWGDDDRGPVPLKGKEPRMARDDVIGSRLGGGFEETAIGFVAKDAQTLSGLTSMAISPTRPTTSSGWGNATANLG